MFSILEKACAEEKKPLVIKMRKPLFIDSKGLALVLTALLLMLGVFGCVASRREVSTVANDTYEVRETLRKLQKEMSQRLKAIEGLDGEYDFNNNLLVDRHALDRVTHSMVTIRTQTLFETTPPSNRVARESTGLGIVVGSYVLTLDHVVTQRNLEVTTPFGRVHLPAKKIEEKNYLVEGDQKLILKRIMADPELDIVLFELPGIELQSNSLPCPVGNSDELTVGTFLYVVGNPFNSGINIREGIVSSLTGLEGIEQIEARRDDLFVISNGVAPGDSGGAVLGLRDGVPELVGLIQGTLGTSRIGWAIKINPVFNSLAKSVDSEEFCVVRRPTLPSFQRGG
jgi:S1-C subfamily serine protease